MKDRLREKIFVFGASGHGKVVIDIIERQGLYDLCFLVDDDPALKGCRFFGYEVIGGRNELLDFRQNHRNILGIVAIGSNTARGMVAAWLTENGFGLISAIHPSALLSRGVVIGKGSVLMAGTVVNADTVIGDNVIINTGATVDHDCVIGRSAHIAPGVTLCGTARIGDETLLGVGVKVLPNITIGSKVIVAAGATVVSDVPEGVQVMGTPARIICKH